MTADTTLTPTTGVPNKKSVSRYLPAVARILMGILFFVTGLNGFLNFLPQPKTGIPEFALALQKTGYMLQLVSATQLIAGLLFLINRFVPLALALIAPVIVNIFFFHLFLAPDGLVMAIIIVVLEVYLAWAYRNAFRPMLAARVTPG